MQWVHRLWRGTTSDTSPQPRYLAFLNPEPRQTLRASRKDNKFHPVFEKATSEYDHAVAAALNGVKNSGSASISSRTYFASIHELVFPDTGQRLGGRHGLCKGPEGRGMERTISSPPTSSPFVYNCGKVGQSEKILRPCRTSSSARMLKNLNTQELVVGSSSCFAPAGFFVDFLSGKEVLAEFGRWVSHTHISPASRAGC